MAPSAIALAGGWLVSHKTRGALDGLPYCTFLKPHFLKDRKGTSSRDFDDLAMHVHRTNFLPAHHIEVVDGIPGTTLVRALCDMSATMSVTSLEKSSTRADERTSSNTPSSRCVERRCVPRDAAAPR